MEPTVETRFGSLARRPRRVTLRPRIALGEDRLTLNYRVGISSPRCASCATTPRTSAATPGRECATTPAPLAEEQALWDRVGCA